MYEVKGRRAPATRVPKRGFIVVARTPLEVAYLHWQARRLEQAAQIVSADGVRDVSDLVRLAEGARRAARTSGGNTPDEVWCVVEEADAPELHAVTIPSWLTVGVADPTFPGWLLRHFGDVVPDDPAEVSLRLRKRVPNDDIRSMQALDGRAAPVRSVSSAADQFRPLGDLVESFRSSMREFRGPGYRVPEI